MPGRSAALAEAGYAVVGDLADLRCVDSSFADDERPPTDGEITDAAVAALARVLELRADRTTRRGPRRARPARSLRKRLVDRLRRSDTLSRNSLATVRIVDWGNRPKPWNRAALPVVEGVKGP